MTVEEVKGTPKTLQSILADDEGEDNFEIDVAALEKADMSLPEDYQTEIMAAEMLGHLDNYYRTKAALRAARNQGDHQRATQLGSTMSLSRLAVAVIQQEHPKAKQIADRIAAYRATQAQLQRKALLEVKV